ncbi:MAG: hypothetical protein U0570_07290 [Phycisphaerales bacterium]
MNTPSCPKCRAKFAIDDMNVKEAVAVCRACGAVTKLGVLAEDPAVASVDVSKPPGGCEVVELGNRIEVRASARSLSMAIGTALFGLFWNGIVSIFVLLAISGTLHVTGLGVPHWFPAPRQNGNLMSVGEVVFLWIFLTPFILIGTLLFLAFLVAVAGRCEVVVHSGRGMAATGIGPFMWRQKFDANAVKSVRIGETKWKQNDQTKPVVLIEADRTIRFGSGLTDQRKLWVTAILARTLTGEDRGNRPWLSSFRT